MQNEHLWYQQLYEYAFNHGVFISPYSTAKKNQIMGSVWMDKIIPKEIKANCCQMSSAAHRLLNVNGFIVDSMADIKDANLPAAGNSYRALYNALQLFHPKLQDTKYLQTAPKQKQNETFGTFINRFRGYFRRECQFKRKYSPHEKTELLMSHLYRIYRDLFL